jgi:excisionase family DNA binding protein
VTTNNDFIAAMIEDAVERSVRKVLAEGSAQGRSRDQPRLFSIPEAAHHLGCSRRSVTYMLARGELSCVRHGRRTLIDVRDLDEWVTQAKRKGPNTESALRRPTEVTPGRRS